MQRLVKVFGALLALWVMLSLSAFSPEHTATDNSLPSIPVENCSVKTINNGFEAKCSDKLVKPLGRTSEMFLRKKNRSARKAYA